MAVRTADAQWDGSLREGKGHMRLGGGAYEGAYSFQSRFEEGQGTNPEELIAAAHSGCFSMALAGELGRAGYEPNRVSTTARVHLLKREEGFTIARIELDTEGDVPGIDEATFLEKAEAAKAGCPVSRALKGGPEITVTARLA
jgi:lipoyl-dependent peroxiredoxin